jgi:hypothetical protein
MSWFADKLNLLKKKRTVISLKEMINVNAFFQLPKANDELFYLF